MSADLPFSYDSIADAYAAGIDHAPYNALYERPAMMAPLPDVAGARVPGLIRIRRKHPVFLREAPLCSVPAA